MPKRRVSKVVRQCGSLGRIGTKTAERSRELGLFSVELLGQASRDLGNFERMGQSVVKHVPVFSGNNLGDLCKPGKSRRIMYAIPVYLGWTSVAFMFL